MKFILDRTLGRLARWLRILGYDTLYFKGEIGRDLLNEALKENRIVITRKQDMLSRNFRGSMIVLKEDRVENQVKEIMGKLPLMMSCSIFTICLICNEKLERISREAVKSHVPEYIFATQSDFRICPRCERIYWPGTHRERALKFMKLHIQTNRL